MEIRGSIMTGGNMSINIHKKFGIIETIKTIIMIVKVVRRHNNISDEIKKMEEEKDDNCIKSKQQYIVTDIDTNLKTLGFREVTKDDFDKADEISSDIIRYITIRYPDLSPAETYVMLNSLIKSFEDYTEYAFGERIKMIKTEDVFSGHDIMFQ